MEKAKVQRRDKTVTENNHPAIADEPDGETTVDNGEGTHTDSSQPAAKHKEAQGETINPPEVWAGKATDSFLVLPGRAEKSSAGQRT